MMIKIKKSDDKKMGTVSEEPKELPKYMTQVTFCVFPGWSFLTEHFQQSVEMCI